MPADRTWTSAFAGIEVEGGDLGEILDRAYRPARGGQRSGYRLTTDDLIAVSRRIGELADYGLEASSGWAGEAVDTGQPEVDLTPAVKLAEAERDALAKKVRFLLISLGVETTAAFEAVEGIIDEAAANV